MTRPTKRTAGEWIRALEEVADQIGDSLYDAPDNAAWVDDLDAAESSTHNAVTALKDFLVD